MVDGLQNHHHRPDRLDAGFEQFVSATSPRLLRSAYLLLGDQDDAEDLLQSALMRTLRRWRAISGSPAAYALPCWSIFRATTSGRSGVDR